MSDRVNEAAEPETEAGRTLLGDATIYGPNADEVRQVILAIEREATDAAMVAAFDDVRRIDATERATAAVKPMKRIPMSDEGRANADARLASEPHPVDRIPWPEPATAAVDVERLADFILGKIESEPYQGLHPELASMGLAVAIRDEFFA